MVIGSRFRISRRFLQHCSIDEASRTQQFLDGTLLFRFLNARARKNIHVVLALKALFGIVL